MSRPGVDHCSNCCRSIESAPESRVWSGFLLCGSCHKRISKLTGSLDKTPSRRLSPAPPVAAGFSSDLHYASRPRASTGAYKSIAMNWGAGSDRGRVNARPEICIPSAEDLLLASEAAHRSQGFVPTYQTPVAGGTRRNLSRYSGRTTAQHRTRRMMQMIIGYWIVVLLCGATLVALSPAARAIVSQLADPIRVAMNSR